MPRGPLFRLLDVVRHRLDARDARIEIGGDPPADPRLVAAPLADGWRVVACFDAPPDDPEAEAAKLRAIGEAFAGVVERHPRPPVDAPAHDRRAALEQALRGLARDAGGCCAMVVDDSSPVLWAAWPADLSDGLDADGMRVTLKRLRVAAGGAPSLEPPDDAKALVDLADLDPARYRAFVVAAGALAGIPRGQAGRDAPPRWVHQGDDRGAAARRLANIYWVVVGFDGPFSELAVDGVMRRAAPAIEKLIHGLPPLDPRPRGKIVPLPRP